MPEGTLPGWFPAIARIAGALVVLYLLAGGMVWIFAERMIFQPHAPGYTDATLVPTADGDSIATVWLPNPDARYAILYSHGNGEDLGDLRGFLPRLRDAGFSVLAYDYRGYGMSTRRAPTERRAYADIEAAYLHLTRTLGVPPERVIIHGRSLGGGVASELASRRTAAALILESSFTSAFAVVSPRRIFPFDRFGTEARLERVRRPVLVIHGTRDEVIAFAHGARLFARANEPKQRFWVEGAGHNDLVHVAGDAYWRTLRAFAATLPADESR
jgi:pimeloyl-ACP methyl ester carboxylesterase